MIQCDNCGIIFMNTQLLQLHSCKTIKSSRKKIKIKNKEIQTLITDLISE